MEMRVMFVILVWVIDVFFDGLWFLIGVSF